MVPAPKGLMTKNFLGLFTDKSLYASDYQKAITLIAGLIFGSVALRYARQVYLGGHGWLTGDWLINYQGGFIRRGLLGDVLLKVSSSGLNILWLTFFLQVITYLSLLYFVLRLFFSRRREISWLLFLFSPVFVLLFPLNNVQGAFRKETIVFLSFTLLCFGLLKKSHFQRYATVSLIIFIIAVLSHELSALCLPLFLFAIHNSVVHDPSRRAAAALYGLGFASIACLGFMASILNLGSLAVSNQICYSLILRSVPSSVCGGAIEWLQYDASIGMDRVLATLPENLMYIPMLGISLIPVFLSDWWKDRVWFLLISFIPLLPLFVVGLDWGRWISIYVFMIFVYIFYESNLRKVSFKGFSFASVLFYAILWKMPHCGTPRLRSVLLGLTWALFLAFQVSAASKPLCRKKEEVD
jgi:hypothetical protein